MFQEGMKTIFHSEMPAFIVYQCSVTETIFTITFCDQEDSKKQPSRGVMRDMSRGGGVGGWALGKTTFCDF
jgi:hypothetical protein